MTVPFFAARGVYRALNHEALLGPLPLVANQAASLVYTAPDGGSIIVDVPVGAVQAPTTLLYQTLSTPTVTPTRPTWSI